MLSPPKPDRIRIYEYQFEIHVTHCKVKVNFPCTFFLSWNTGSKTANDDNNVKAIADTIPFNSDLKLTLEIPFDESTNTFLEKKTLLFVNLRPGTNPNEVRMAGVVSIDLAVCLNTNNMNELKKYYLERCPDKSSFLMLSVKSKFVKELTIQDMNKGSPASSPVPPLILERTDAASADKKVQQNRSVDRKAIRERLGITTVRLNLTDRPKGATEAPVEMPTPAMKSEASQQASETKEPVRYQPQMQATLRQNIRALDSDSNNEEQTRNQDKRSMTQGSEAIALSSHENREKGQREPSAVSATGNIPSSQKLQHEQWLTKMHENAYERKSQLMESSLREEIVKLKNVCQSLDKELNNEHVYRIKLEAELEHARVENLQLKQTEKDLMKEIATLRPIEQEHAIRNMRRSLDKLQAQNADKAKRISILEQEILNFTRVKLQLAKRIQELSQKKEEGEEGVMSPSKSIFRLPMFALEQKEPVQTLNGTSSAAEQPQTDKQPPTGNTQQSSQMQQNAQSDDKITYSTVHAECLRRFAQLQAAQSFSEHLLEQKDRRIVEAQERLAKKTQQLLQLQKRFFAREDELLELPNLSVRPPSESPKVDTPIRGLQDNRGDKGSDRKSRFEDYPATAVSQVIPDECSPKEAAPQLVVKTSLEQSTLDFQAHKIEQLQNELQELKTEAEDRGLIVKYLQDKREKLEASLKYFQQENNHLQAAAKDQLKRLKAMEREMEEYHANHSGCGNAIRTLSEQLLVKSFSSFGEAASIAPPERSPSSKSNRLPRSRLALHSPPKANSKEPPLIPRPSSQFRPSEDTDSQKLQLEIVKFKTELHDTQNELQNQRRRIQQLSETVDILRQEREERLAEVQDYLDRNELLERSVAKFVLQIEALERTVAEQKSKMSKSEAQFAQTERQLQLQLQIQKSSSKQELVRLEQNNMELVKTIQLYEQSLGDKQKQLDSVEQKLQEADSRRLESSRMAVRYRDSLEKIQRQLQGESSKPVTHSRRPSETESDLQTSVSELQEVLTTLTRKHKSLFDSTNSMKFGFERLARELSLQLNRIKCKLLSAPALSTEGKKTVVANLRPIQLKIEDILSYSEHAVQVDQEDMNSDQDASDPLELKSPGRDDA